MKLKMIIIATKIILIITTVIRKITTIKLLLLCTAVLLQTPPTSVSKTNLLLRKINNIPKRH